MDLHRPSHEGHEEHETGPSSSSSANDNNTHSSLLTCAFNQDGGCVAVGTTQGFSVHNLHPTYGVSVHRELRGGIAHIGMLFRCNLLAIVGGGPSPHAAPHRVLIWDDHVPKEVGELSFRQAVLSVQLRKDAICVGLRDRVYVYQLADLSLRDKIYTADNPFGLLSVSTHVKDMVLACPSVTTGHVRVELYGLRKTVLLEAHDSPLRGLALTADGQFLATASVKGTILRVWNVSSSHCVYEFRRGVERATITCLTFSWDHRWLAAASDKGTVHVFFCEPQNDESAKQKNGGKKSSTSTASSLKRLWKSTTGTSSSSGPQKSVCQIRGIPHPLACAFVGDVPNLLAVAGWDADGHGVLLLSEFVAHQEARRVGYHVLVKNGSAEQESEEARRRRRARGWKPSVPDTPADFAHLHISDNTHQRVVTNDVEEDFCEVVVETPPPPVIDNAPPPIAKGETMTPAEGSTGSTSIRTSDDEEEVIDGSIGYPASIQAESLDGSTNDGSGEEDSMLQASS